MASWLSREISDDGEHLPPLKQKSKIPVRLTRLSSDNDKSSSSEDEADKKPSLSKDSVEKLQSQGPSRIPILVGQKKNKIEKDKLPMKNVRAVMGEKPVGRDSGINLRETRGKQVKTKFSTSPPTVAKRSSRKLVKESTPQVRRRIPRELSQLETVQVSEDEKEPLNETSASDSSSATRTDEITPDFECNIARVEVEDLTGGAKSDMSGSEYGDDFERYSVSSDEQTLPNVPPWLRETVKEQKAAKLAENEKNASQSANDTTTELGTGHKVIHEDLTVTSYPAPKDICTDFVADELDKIIADLTVMNADMTDEEHADAMASLLLLRDEARDREEAVKGTKHNISENNEAVKDDATITSLVDDAVKPVFEEESNLDEKATSDEEFDCSSVTVSSEGERKIAALDEKSRRLKAQFAEENRLAIESMDKIREEIKQSQEREDAITNDMEEMRHRQDEIKQDLRRLDEMSKRREREEEKWKAKIDKKKKKIARRLEKVRAGRLEYQRETEAANENPENQSHSAVEWEKGAGPPVEQECKDAAQTTTNCLKEDLSNIILYESHEIKEYSSVKQLEKKRKELRRLEKMEKKAIKREKLEQRERTKIEKEKRKVAHKLEKLRAKSSSERNVESSQCVTDQAQGVSISLLQGNSKEYQTVNPTEHQTTHFTAPCELDQQEQDALNEASVRVRDVRPSVSNRVILALGNPELDISEDMKKPVLESIICDTEGAELAPEEVVDQRSFRLQNDKFVNTEGTVEEELEKKQFNEFVMENSKESSHSGDNQMDNEDALEDFEIDCVQEADTLKDISMELFDTLSIEDELYLIEPHTDTPQFGGALERNFKSKECASKTAATEYDELPSSQGEILVNNSLELVKACGSFATNTNTLTPTAEILGEISVYSEMAQDEIPVPCFNFKEALAKTDDFDDIDGGFRNNDGSLQCWDDTNVELSTCSKESKWSGDSLEKRVPGPEYVKENGNDVAAEFVNDGNNDTIDMSLGVERFGHDNACCIGNGNPISNEPSPLMRKVSGRFTPGGIQPLFNSPGPGEFNSIFEDTVPSEEVEDEVRNEDGQFPLEESSSLNHLETGSFKDEKWSHDHFMSLKNLPKKIQEARIQRYAASVDVEGDENVQVDIVYEEISRRSSDPNSFSIVCEEVSVQTCDQECCMEQDIVEENDDASIKETSLSEECPLAFVEYDKMRIKQESVDVPETKHAVELGGSRVKVGCDHHEPRESIDERRVKEFTLPLLTASEALSVESSLVHSPDLQSSTAGRYNKTAFPKELNPIPMKAASTSNSLETLANGHFKCSERVASHQEAFTSQSTTKHNFKEDDVISESDHVLDEVDASLEMVEKQGGAKTVDTAKIFGAFAQSAFDSKTQEAIPDHYNNKHTETSGGLKEDTPSHQEMYEDNNISLSIADQKSVLETKVALHCSPSQHSGNGEDVQKAFRDGKLHPVFDTPIELHSSALMNDSLQSNVSSDKDDYTSERRASNFGSIMLQTTDSQKMLQGSEITDVYSRGKTYDFSYGMDRPLSDIKVEDEQRLLMMNLNAMNKKNQQVMDKNTQKEKKYFDEKSGYDSSSTNSTDVKGIATEISQADGSVERAGDASPVSGVQERLGKENTEVEKSHSICETGDELDSWGSIDYMVSSDFHCVTGGNEEFVLRAPDLCDVDNGESNQKNEDDRITLEHEASPVSVLESTMKSPERHRDSLLSSSKDENISVAGERVKSTNDEACALEMQVDTKLDADNGLAPPRVKKRISSAHEDTTAPHIDDEFLMVTEECQRIEYHEQSVLQVTPGMDRNRPKDNKAAVSDVKASSGDAMVSVDSIMHQKMNALLEENFSQADTPSQVSRRSHSTKRFFSGKGKVSEYKLDEDEFIDDFDLLIDEVEEDIRIEESLSSPESNPHSSKSKNVFEEIEDQSIIDVETRDESVTWLSDIGIEGSLLSSCDEEVAAINDGILEVISDYEEEPDSWDALDELVDRLLQTKPCSFALDDGENRMSDEGRRARYARTVAAVVNISEHLLQQELMAAVLAAVEAATCEVTEKDAWEDEVKPSVTKDRVHGYDDTNRPTEDKMKTHVTNKGKGGPVSREKARVGDTIEKLNKLHSKVNDTREQLSGGNGHRGKTFSAKTEIDSATVPLNSIRTLDNNNEEMAEEFKQANEKSNKKSDEHVGAEMLEESRKENAQMLVEITVMQEEVEAFQRKNESLHSELEATKAELKCLQSKDEYMQRELTNLKDDFEKKEKKWEEVEKTLENALTDKIELLDDLECLDESLRFSRENNQKLNTWIDDLHEIIKELKEGAKMENKRYEYGHLREEVELLKGSLELSNQRETLLRCQLDGLETEVSHFKHCEQTLKSNLRTVSNEKSRIIEQLEEQLSTAENENSRMITELSRASDRENLLNELKDENLKVIKQLEDQLNKLTKESSTLNAELSKVSEKDIEITELKSETTKVIKQLEDQLGNLTKENHYLSTELYKVSEKDNEITELKTETTKVIKQLEDQLGNLTKENHYLSTELYKVSEKDNEITELKTETTKVIKQLEDQLASLTKENHHLATELYKVSEKDDEITELKTEATKAIKQLQDQLAILKKENHDLATELSRVSEKDNEMIELKSETSNVIKQLEDQLNKLTKENATLNVELARVQNKLEDKLANLRKDNHNLVTELCKTSEKDKEMIEFKGKTSTFIKQLEDELATLRKENSTLTAELYKASEKDNQMRKLKRKTSKVIKQLEDQVATLKEENSTLATELSKASEKDNQISELQNETPSVIRQLEDQLAALEKENSTLATELSKVTKKDNEMSELQSKASNGMKQLEDQLATLKKENSTLATELSKVTKKDNEMSELKSEASNGMKQLKDQLATLKKENSTLATELSKVSEKDKKLTELLNQVENLTTQNKLLHDQALETKKLFPDELQCPQEETSELGEGSMRSRRSRRSKSSDIKMLRKRVRQNEQELEFFGRFIRQRGLEFGRRPQYHIYRDPKDEPGELPSVEETLNHGQDHERGKQNTSQVQEMEKVIEVIKKSLRETEKDLQQTKGALTVKTERTEFLERRVAETEMLLEETSKRLSQNQYNLEQTAATLRQQLERSATLENQLEGMKNARNSALTSIRNKDQELEEAFRRICQKDQRIDDLIHELKEERFDKECLKRVIEVTEYNGLRDKGLLERLRELENQSQLSEELKDTTLASLMVKQQELDQSFRSLDNKGAQIHDLAVELKQEGLDKDFLKGAITVTESNLNREKGLLERSAQLEKQLQEMQELREKTLASLRNDKEALEQANDKIDELNQRLKREISDNECLRSTVEATECNAKREKKLLEKRRTNLEIQLEEMEKVQERTQSSLKSKETELQQAYTSLNRKDDRIDELKQGLKQERSGKRKLKKVMEITSCNVERQKILLNDKDEEVGRLKEQLCDYEKKIEKLDINLNQMKKELEVAEDILTYRQNNVGNAGISSRIQYDHFPIKQSSHTKESVREIGSLMVHVTERLSKLLQRQKEVGSSAALLKQKEAETKLVVERLREELSQRDNELESLKSAVLKSVTEAEFTRGRLREVEFENNDLKKALADESDQVKKLEILVKQLERDVQRMQNSLKDKETTLEETKETLQIKRSLLTSMEAKLSLRDNEIEELRAASKDRGLERVQTSLKEVKRDLEISSSIITKQNERIVHFRSSVNRKTWETDKMKPEFRVEPTQNEARLLSIQLEHAKKEKGNLSRELAAATGRLEKEQVLADSQKKALQEQVKSGLEDLNAKTKLIWDMKMSLQESNARISRLEAEKLEQEECFSDYKREIGRGFKRLKQSLNMANENESLLQSGIGSTGREMTELRKENQRLKFELLLKENGDLPEDGIEDASSGLFKQTDFDGKRQEAITWPKKLDNEVKGDMTASCHGDIHERQKSSDTRMQARHLDKIFSSRGDETILPARNQIVTDSSTKSANKISILPCSA